MYGYTYRYTVTVRAKIKHFSFLYIGIYIYVYIFFFWKWEKLNEKNLEIIILIFLRVIVWTIAFYYVMYQQQQYLDIYFYQGTIYIDTGILYKYFFFVCEPELLQVIFQISRSPRNRRNTEFP